MRANNNFDFDMVGKRLPYPSEDKFLSNATDLTLKKINKLKYRRRMWGAVSSVAASIVIILGVATFNYQNNISANNLSIDELISDMSDSRLEEFVYMVESDAFLVNDFNL